MRKMMASLYASALLFAGLAGTASAQVEQDGLVNVNVGDVTLTDTVDAAVLIAANVCPNVNVGAVAILADRVDAGNVRQVTLCRTDDGRVTITNN
jgi:hypothetical protein